MGWPAQLVGVLPERVVRAPWLSAERERAMSCPECGSPFPLSHYGDCRAAVIAPDPSAERGRAAYEEDVRRCPNYHDGTPRKTWGQLTDVEQYTWRANPTARDYAPKDYR